MPDDMLKDAIDQVRGELDAMKDAGKNLEEDGLRICEKVKRHFDKTWSPHWHVVIGYNFGTFCTHETNMYLYFYYGSFGARSTRVLPPVTRRDSSKESGHFGDRRVRDLCDRQGRSSSAYLN